MTPMLISPDIPSSSSSRSLLVKPPSVSEEALDTPAERHTNSDSDALTDPDSTFPGRRQIGILSAVFINFNTMVGTGVFATTSTILLQTGSVGMTLVTWAIGSIIAFAGMWTYIIWGIALPRNGGEKNYVEYPFTRPKYLTTCVFAANGVLLARAAGNTLVFGEYFVVVAHLERTRWAVCSAGVGCITFAFLLHGIALKWGLRLQNVLGIFKVAILAFIVVTGWVALAGRLRVEKPHNFRNAFDGTTTSASSLCTGLYNVIWSFNGYQNLNYGLSEVKNPRRTIRIAGPLAVGLVAALYMLANIGYFAGASLTDIRESGRLVAGLLIRNVYGEKAEQALSIFISFSALGNVLSTIFARGRVNQELGREGVLFYSGFWASNKPFNAPLAGLGLHWLVCIIIICALPPGDAFNFVLNTMTYPLSVINVAMSFGVVYLHFTSREAYWSSISIQGLIASSFFGVANVFLVVVPFIKPPKEPYEKLPYWAHAVAGWAVFGIGALYWVIWARILPAVGRYELVREHGVGADGLSGYVFKRIPKAQSS